MNLISIISSHNEETKKVTNIFFKKQGKIVRDLGRHFSKEKGQIINKYMKSCLISVAIRGNEISTLLEWHITIKRHFF